MPHRKNKYLTRNIIAAVVIIGVIVTAAIATVYFATVNSQKNKIPLTNPTLEVGDTFTYNLTGSVVLGDVNAVTPGEFLQYNETEYYQVNVTTIQGSQVSLETTWQFKNGTQVRSPQEIDLSNGACEDLSGFKYLYPSNLNVTDLLYPQETNNLVVTAQALNSILILAELRIIGLQKTSMLTPATKLATQFVMTTFLFTSTNKQECLTS